MDIQNRLLRIVWSADKEVLIASDVRGRVHKFDAQLNLIQSSPVVSYDRPVNSICLSDQYIFTKDRFGAIGKWDLDTLQPLDFYDGKLICDREELMDNEEPSPTPNRGITCFKGRVYTNNGYNQMVVLDAETFEVSDIRPSPSPTFIDCICTDHPEIHAMSDVDGTLFIGNIETNEFPVVKKVDTMVVHGVVYDKRHDRFWTTQDGGLGDDRFVLTGVTTVEKDGSGFKEFKLSTEDNEFITFDPDHRYLFAGGFNGKISIFDNETQEYALKKVIGPLEFQIIHGAVVNKDQIYALLQTGDLIRLNGQGEEVCRARYHNRCVWILSPHPDDESLLYAGTDQGVSLISYRPGKFGTVHIEQIDKHQHGFGVMKDVKPLPDGSYVAIARSGYAVKADVNGSIQWQRQVLGIPRSIALNATYEKCLVSTDEGIVYELSVSDGTIVDTLPVGSPSYACIYTPDGRRVCSADKGQQIRIYAGDGHELLGTITGFTYRIKRMMKGSNGSVFAAGPDGLFELDLEAYAVKKAFGDYLVSTKENGVLVNGNVYMGGYGYQLGTYRYEDGKILDLEETLPDFTKVFAARIPEDGVPILLVGGRGGFINVYRLYKGIPNKVREYYIR